MERLVESKYLWECKACGEDCKYPHGVHAWLLRWIGGEQNDYVCRWCDDQADSQESREFNTPCRYAYYTQMPDGFESVCTTCGKCDDDEREGAKAQQAMLCQLGECSGMHYDVVMDNMKGEILCLNCFEISH